MTNIDPRQEWATPPDFIDAIKREFQIDIDVSASIENAVVPNYIDAERDGLMSRWFYLLATKTAWCNPGFSNMAPWIEQAIRQVSTGPGLTAVVMGLVSPSTKWWETAVEAGAEIRMLSPRVQFIPAPSVEQSSNSRENAIFIFRSPVGRGKRPAHIWRWRWK
jgi:phage N-6-adenine-methyltransferase